MRSIEATPAQRSHLRTRDVRQPRRDQERFSSCCRFPPYSGRPRQEGARGFCRRFFPWYNDAHRHSGLGYHTPADVHYGRAERVRAGRVEVLTAAYAAHPERFVRKAPEPPQLPGPAWINRPREEVMLTN